MDLGIAGIFVKLGLWIYPRGEKIKTLKTGKRPFPIGSLSNCL